MSTSRPVAELLEEWQLTPDGSPVEGTRAVVVPVRTRSGRPAMLKVGGPDTGRLEHLALQHWHGRGAAELLRADPHRGAVLLERLHREDLADLWDVEACEIVGGLYRRLHVPAPPQLPLLSSYAARWAVKLRELPRSAPLPRRLVEQAASLARDLADDPETTGTMLHGDLHYGHVLAGDRQPWAAISPAPLSGDPHAEPAPMLWHRFEELAGNVRNGVRARFHALIDTAELDEDRARDWVVVRTVVRAATLLGGAAEGGGDGLTRCITIAKAVQD